MHVLTSDTRCNQPAATTAETPRCGATRRSCWPGMWTLDTADNYGPSEATIGQHLRLNPGAQGVTRVFTKLSFMTPPPAADLRRDAIEYVSDLDAQMKGRKWRRGGSVGEEDSPVWLHCACATICHAADPPTSPPTPRPVCLVCCCSVCAHPSREWG